MSVDKKSSYYDAGGIEVMEVIRAKLSPEQFRGFLHGNILKYSGRMNFKGSYDRDLEKVGVYQGLLSELPTLGRAGTGRAVIVPEDEKEHADHLVLSNQRLTSEVSDQAVTISDLKHTIDLQMERIKGYEARVSELEESWVEVEPRVNVEADGEYWRKKFTDLQGVNVFLKRKLDERCAEIYDLGKKLAEK